MNKNEVYAYLNEKNINYEITNHSVVFNMEELENVNLPYKELDAKNLFVRDDKKNKYYLITVKCDKRVDLKLIRKEYNTRPLSFAKEDELLDILKLTPGSVSPLGILNDKTKKVTLFLDKYFIDKDYIGVPPNNNTATIWLQPSDLINIIKEQGNDVIIYRYLNQYKSLDIIIRLDIVSIKRTSNFKTLRFKNKLIIFGVVINEI